MRLFLVALCALILGSMQVLAACAGRSGEAASDGGDGDVLLPAAMLGIACCRPRACCTNTLRRGAYRIAFGASLRITTF
jgi:hypothetical protein